MSMSRRHYEAVARVMRYHRVLVDAHPNAVEIIDDISRDLAAAFYSDNHERFDRERFLAACGVDS